MAFKGEPENQDLRDSISLKIAKKLEVKSKKLFCWDGVIKDKIETNKKLRVLSNKEFNKISKKIDIFLILNNNTKNKFLDFNLQSKKKKLIFDGWNQLDQTDVEKNKSITYATMGYMTNK